MLVSIPLPVERAHRLYPCDIDGNPVPRGGGIVYLDPDLWRIEYRGGRFVAVCGRLPIIEVLYNGTATLIVRSLASMTWTRGVVETNLGYIQGYLVPPLAISDKYEVLSMTDDVDVAPPKRVYVLAY